MIVALIGIGFLLSEQAHVERSETINAPPATVFALVNSFRQFEKWSPWAGKDPGVKVERSGPEFGVGAKYVWAGNEAVGTGSQEIVASTPFREVKIKLSFGGFDGASEATYTITPAGEGGSRIVWAFDSHLGGNPVNRYFGLFMDKMLGPDYVLGLSRLKTLAESLPKGDFSSLRIELLANQPLPYAFVSGAATTEVAEIGKALAAAYGKVGAAMQAAGLRQAGAPLAVTRRYDPAAKIYEFDAAIPVDRIDAALPPTGDVKFAKTPEGKILRLTHQGAYATLPKSYEQLAAFEAAYGFAENGNAWEQYVSDPRNTPEADLLTTINVPVK
ncbi:MAG: SRPBCC family protein [Nevskia sp.]